MGIVDEDIDRLRSTVSIVDTIQQYVALKRVGRNWVGLCPFHAEKSGSFNVTEERGRYKCFGCDKGGDVFTFIQEIEHLDFPGAVEHLAAKAGIQLNYTTSGQSEERSRRKKLTAAMNDAVEWYHQRLLEAPDARAARDYLRKRGLAGDIARQFKIGWAPDDWDQLSRNLGAPTDVMQDVGLSFRNRRNKMQDAFRGRVMFPIFSESGEALAFGGRVLPGSDDPAKYKNSSETPIYMKSKTLYGLNWAKADIAKKDQVVVCEGYTDVIGFHRAGVPRAVATCGTALTEEHVRLLKRYASKVVLSFDADAAGQGAAERFYEWEEKHKVEVLVAQLPDGKDPGDLASSQPEALVAAVDKPVPFLKFRLGRTMRGRPKDSPEHRVRLAEDAMAVVNEHPNKSIRMLYAGEVAAELSMPVSDMVRLAERGTRRPAIQVQQKRSRGPIQNAEFAALVLLVQDWDSIAPWLLVELFDDDVNRMAFIALGEAGGDLSKAIEIAPPDAVDILERAAVADLNLIADVEARTLIGAACRRELQQRVRVIDPEGMAEDRQARLDVEALQDTESTRALAAAESLLGWLHRRSEERSDGEH
ncbi:MAG: DNA primase [Ilumatobacter sp.]|nr:DNA primase [Ilumatobacter sp.]|tara:strand:- start:1516 stop:3279 length:1764 start_codon:yes stop_codon:yes gene_type:complete